MIECPSVAKRVVRQHYDLVTPFYWLLWGRHIHHGLWNGQESPVQAQQQLTETLAREADMRNGETVLDVGCGMGGSAIHLARTFDCRVTGITLSRLQRFWACRRPDGTVPPTIPTFVVRMPNRRTFRHSRSTWCGASSVRSICTTRPGFSDVPSDGYDPAAAWPFAPGWLARHSKTSSRYARYTTFAKASSAPHLARAATIGIG